MVIKINLSQLITMLNGNKENENRHRPECMKFVVLFNIIQLLDLNEINMRFYGAGTTILNEAKPSSILLYSAPSPRSILLYSAP